MSGSMKILLAELITSLGGTVPPDDEPKREIYLPLSKLDQCSACRKQGQEIKLRWCTSCGEVLYCSTECQKKDWKEHKAFCGITDRMDIQSYYPFIAAIAYCAHMHPAAFKHPALSHKIVNSPNPDTRELVVLPNGVRARLVLLGESVARSSLGSTVWWPTGLSHHVRHKLLRRITTEGLQLPIMLASTVALVSEIYSTTAEAHGNPDSKTGRRIRLSHARSPIADFGIVQGSVHVEPENRLAYFNMQDKTFLMGQDPSDHYWIYFTTLAGDEYFLDCGMMTFNYCTMVDGTPYCRLGMPDMGPTPAFFYGREQEKMLPLKDRIGWTPRKRFSILRDPRITKAIQRTNSEGAVEFCECHDEKLLISVMDEIAGRKCSEWEQGVLMKLLPNICRITRMNMQAREYVHFPKNPQIIFEIDPGQNIIGDDTPEDKAYEKYLKKWARRLKKGKVTANQWEEAFNAWKNKPSETRLAMAGM